ncbi:MAG: tetratricopeptide repeat protein [Phycisphaerales bacterium]
MPTPESPVAGTQPGSRPARPRPACLGPAAADGAAAPALVRTIALAATLSVAAALGGCGGGGEDDSDSPTNGTDAGARSPSGVVEPAGTADGPDGGQANSPGGGQANGRAVIAPAAVPVPASNDPVAIPTGVDLDPETANILEARRVAASVDPDSIAARTRYALALQAAQLDEPAMRTWEQVVAAGPNDPTGWYFLAITRRQIGQTDEAMAALHRSIAAGPDYLPAQTRRGFWHLENGDPVAASTDFSAVLRVVNGDPAASIGMARVLIQAGEDEQASAILAVLRRSEPRDAYVRFLYGGVLQRLGRSDLARFELEAGAGSQFVWGARDPRMLAVANQRVGPRARISMGQQLVGAGQFSAARDRVAPLVNDPATDAAPRIILAEAIRGLGDPARAIELLVEGSEARPEDASLVLNLALHQHQAGDADAALRLVRKAISMNETTVDAHLLLATLHREAGRHTDAEAAARRALELDPNGFRSNFTLGVAIYDQGTRQREALAQLQLARQRHPERWESWYYIAVLLADDNQPEQAARFAERAARLAPPNHPLITELLRALAK